MIFEIHGSMHAPDESSLTHRRLLDRNKFLQWAVYHSRFVSLTDALKGNGAGITIDDGTFAAFETALEIKSMGHEVTVFINMYNILTQQPYHFHKMSLLIDTLFQKRNLIANNYDTIEKKESYRALIKKKLISMKNEEEINRFLIAYAEENGLDYNFILPWELRSIGLKECEILLKAGVNLGNHCFQHISPQSLKEDDFIYNVTYNSILLRQYFDIKSQICAIPYGKSIRLPKQILKNYTWLLADKTKPVGHKSQYIYNRHSLDNNSSLENTL